MGTDTLSRRELLRLKPNARDVDYAGWTQHLRGEFDGVDRAPLRRALAPVAATLAEQRSVARRPGPGRGGPGRPDAAIACDLLDLEDLPHPDDSFDAVVSAFGFAHAPRARRTAQELVARLQARRDDRARRVGAARAPRRPRGARRRARTGSSRPRCGARRNARAGGSSRCCTALTVRLRTVRIEFPTADAMYEQLVPPRAATCARRSTRCWRATARAAAQPRPPPATC